MNRYTARSRACVLTGSLATLLLASAARGEPAPTFDTLLRQTADAPRIADLNAGVAKAQGLARQAYARPNPTVSVYAENFAGTGPFAGFGGTQTTLQLDQPIEWGGKRSSRIAAGDAGVAAAKARTLDGRIAYAYELARAYVGAEIADRRIELAEDEVEEATADLGAARALVEAGKEARLRQLQAETDLNALKADLEEARARRTAALTGLSALAGQDVPYTGLSESLLDRLAAHTASGPVDPARDSSYLAAKAERDAADMRLAAERKRALPNVTAQIGFRRLDYERANAVVAGVAIPLNIFDRNRGNVDAAQADLAASQAREAQAKLDAEAASRSAVALVEAADLRAAAAARTMATAEETYRLARIAYQAGKSPLIELLSARHGLGVARGVTLDAAAARFQARAGLARLQGRSITGEPIQ